MKAINKNLSIATLLALSTAFSVACGGSDDSGDSGDGDGDAMAGDGDGDTGDGDGDTGDGDGDTGDGDGDTGDGDGLGGAAGDGDSASGGTSGDGDGDGGSVTLGPLAGSCALTGGTACIGYYGTFWTYQAVEGGCAGSTPSMDACDLTGAEGYCDQELTTGTAATRSVYYGDGSTHDLYESICVTNGVWTSLLP